MHIDCGLVIADVKGFSSHEPILGIVWPNEVVFCSCINYSTAIEYCGYIIAQLNRLAERINRFIL